MNVTAGQNAEFLVALKQVALCFRVTELFSVTDSQHLLSSLQAERNRTEQQGYENALRIE
jgi:hypothetical protein